MGWATPDLGGVIWLYESLRRSLGREHSSLKPKCLFRLHYPTSEVFGDPDDGLGCTYSWSLHEAHLWNFGSACRTIRDIKPIKSQAFKPNAPSELFPPVRGRSPLCSRGESIPEPVLRSQASKVKVI